MPRGIQLTRYGIAEANHWHLAVWRFRVEVTAVSGGMESKIFLFRRVQPDPGSQITADKFVTVASIADLSKYPVDDVDPDADAPMYRTNSVELDFESQEDYEKAWIEFQRVIGNLVSGLDKAEDLVVEEEIWIGEQP